MKIRVARHAGFCSGVSRAVEAVLAETGRGVPVSILGPLVHNEAVSRYLHDRGAAIVADPEEAPGGILVIRTHGVSPAVYVQCQKLNLEVRDCTCARVRRAQRLAADLAAKQIQVLIFGDPRHPEVVGLVGWSEGRAVVLTAVQDLDRVNLEKPSALLAQTTADRAAFDKVKTAFLARAPGGQVFDTLCPETGLRQKEALQLAREADAVVVVGSATSANTRALVEICSSVKPTCRVADAGELDPEFLRGCRYVLVTAGASTPRWTIKEVVESMENEGFAVENEVTFEDGADFKAVQAGEQVTGKVVRATPDEVYVDIGYKTEALLPKNEVYLSEGETLPELFAPGDEIEVTVLKVDDQDNVTVSHKRLAKEKRWRELEQAFNEATVEKGRVKQVVSAGMVLDLGAGIEGFMPGSLVDIRYIPDFNQFAGATLPFKVIEFNREKDKVILSRKVVLEEEAARKKEEALRSLEVGSIIKGVVRRLTDFGAFVDVGGIDGLVHISELAWERVGHSRDVLKVGEEIEVKVLEVIPERERVSLSLRQAQPDPWTLALRELENGQIVKGKITRLANFGAFVELRPGVEGLVHISQIADYHIKHPSEVLHEGEETYVKILEIKPAAKRISLSIKEAGGAANPPEEAVDRSADNGNVTLGDVFGDLFEQEKSAAQAAEDTAPQEPVAKEPPVEETVDTAEAVEASGEAEAAEAAETAEAAEAAEAATAAEPAPEEEAAAEKTVEETEEIAAAEAEEEAAGKTAVEEEPEQTGDDGEQQ